MVLWIEIKGEIDSPLLWSLIKGYGLNLTDLIDKSLVYGECSYSVASRVIAICARFGDISASIKRGDENEQKEESKA